MTLTQLLAKRKDADAATKRGRRKEARPGELLDAALALFVEKGFAGTRSEEVAARAGVSKGTLFLYFPSKEELFKAVVRENIASRFGAWGEELASHPGTPPEQLAFLVRAWWERVGMTPASGLAKLMLAEANTFPEITEFYRREVVLPAQQLVRGILERGVAGGYFALADMEYAVHMVTGPMVYLMLVRQAPGICVPPDEPLDAPRYVEQLVATLLRGFAAKAGS
jgi:TetR/AcrR family transcriptional regulator